MRSHTPWILLVVLLVGNPSLPMAAAEQGSDAADSEVGDAMRRLFRNRLRAELALTDAQMEKILPWVEQIETSRNQARRARQQQARALQRGLREGADDAELERLLGEMDRLEIGQRETERAAHAQIESELTVRQRVQFRFFIERFRNQLQERIRSLRDDRRMRGTRGQRRQGR